MGLGSQSLGLLLPGGLWGDGEPYFVVEDTEALAGMGASELGS